MTTRHFRGADRLGPDVDQVPTRLQVAAARLVVAADRKLGDTTPEWIERLAQGLPSGGNR